MAHNEKPVQYEAPEVMESLDDREIFGDAPATSTEVGGSHIVLHAV